jgi:signal transduction histidine kinase
MKNAVLLTAIIMIALCISNIRAQHFDTDSLENVLKTQELDEIHKLKVLNNLSAGYYYTDREKMFFYAKKGLQLAKKVKNYTFIAKFSDYAGRYYGINGDLDSALKYYLDGIKAAKDGNDIEQESFLYNSIAISYVNISNYTEALNYWLKGLELMEKNNVKKDMMITTLSNIGNIYSDLRDSKNALKYYLRAKDIAENIKDTLLIKHKMDIQYKLQIYETLTNYYMNNKMVDSAQYYLALADSLNEFLNDKKQKLNSLEAHVLLNSLYLKNFEKAEKYAKEMIELAEELGDTRELIGANIQLSNLNSYQGKYPEMEKYARLAYEMDTTNLETALYTTYNMTYANIYLDEKDSAAIYLQKFYAIALKRSGQELHSALADMEVKYETEKKELKIASLEKEKRLYYLIGSLIVLTLFIGFAFLRRLSRQKIQQLEQEKKLIATRAVLEGESTERTRLARDLHDGLNPMLAAVKINLNKVEELQKARDMLDSSIEEVRRIAHHLMPASLLRFGMRVSLEDFCHSFPNVHFHFFGEEKRIEENAEILIYRCVHELVNNAVKYAEANNINVQLVQSDDRISLTVQDDGKGFDTEKQSFGMGLKNLQDRLTAFNGTMDVVSGEGDGTEVNVELRII